MRIEHLLITLIALLLGFSLLACGLFLLVFPNVVLDLRSIGIMSLCVGALLLLVFFLVSRRRYLVLKMGGASIHDKLVRYFAHETLQKLFPQRPIDCEIIVHKKGKIEILAHIPYLSDVRREQTLEEIETQLAAILLKYCGYKDPFIFNVSFS